ncbi:MAG: hypothetical protein HEQ39_09960 [Rhizobacter sp.]
MKLSPVLSPDGRPLFSAGGGHAWKTGVHRGFVVSLEWVGEGRKAYPAMVIWPASNVFVTGEGSGMWVIARKVIVDFVGFNASDKCTGGPSEHCIREAQQALPILGKDINDKEALSALVSCVVTYAMDLVGMPLVPKAIRKELDHPPMWDIKQTDKASGKVVKELEI